MIVLCWLVYPAQNKWWIASHTFSFLGSFDARRNPDWWWLFSIAMIFSAMAQVPLVLYLYRRFTTITRLGAVVGAGCFFVGCLGAVGIALFPDVSMPVFGDIRWKDIHEKATLVVAMGFGFGIAWHALLLITDFIWRRDRSVFRHHALVGPFSLWAGVWILAIGFEAAWDRKYQELKVASAAAGRHIGSSWDESLNTLYAFPLWENLVIATLFVFMIWFVLAVPNRLENSAEKTS